MPKKDKRDKELMKRRAMSHADSGPGMIVYENKPDGSLGKPEHVSTSKISRDEFVGGGMRVVDEKRGKMRNK